MPENARRALYRRAIRVGLALRDVVRGATGADAYASYCSHMARCHPDARPLSRAEFFRRDTAERWDGVRRCC